MPARVAVVIVAFVISAVSGYANAESEPPKGFKVLLGDADNDLAHWKTEGDITKHWQLIDGILHYDGKGERKGGSDDALNLVTQHDYRDFELRVDWKIAPGSDSGIYLRGCPQVQIWDNPEGSGGLYNNGSSEEFVGGFGCHRNQQDLRSGSTEGFRPSRLCPRITPERRGEGLMRG